VQTEKPSKRNEGLLDDLIRRCREYEGQVEDIDSEITGLLNRTLLFAASLLEHAEMGNVLPELHELLGSLIWPALKFTNQRIRALALECLAEFCLLDVEACKRYLFVFKSVLEQHRHSLNEFVAMRACFDFLTMFDILSAEFRTSGEDINYETHEVSGHCVLNLIIGYLESPVPKIKSLAVEGLSKLLLLSRVPHCTAILARLMLCFFEPESDPQVKQCLHVFFTYYSSLNQHNSETLISASKLILGLFADYIKNTEQKLNSRMDFSHLCLRKIFNFVLCYTSPAFIEEHGKFESTKNLHADLLFYIGLSILKSKVGPTIREIYTKILTLVDFSGFTGAEICLAKKMCKKIVESAKPKEENFKRYAGKVLAELGELKSHLGGSVKDGMLYEAVKSRYDSDVQEITKFVQRLNQFGSTNLYTPLKAEGLPLEDSGDVSSEDEFRPVNLHLARFGKREGDENSPPVEKRMRTRQASTR
jgi:hypothetical protein